MSADDLEQRVRRANRMRIDRLDEDEALDVVRWLNGADPCLLEDILNDLELEW